MFHISHLFHLAKGSRRSGSSSNRMPAYCITCRGEKHKATPDFKQPGTWNSKHIHQLGAHIWKDLLVFVTTKNDPTWSNSTLGIKCELLQPFLYTWYTRAISIITNIFSTAKSRYNDLRVVFCNPEGFCQIWQIWHGGIATIYTWSK